MVYGMVCGMECGQVYPQGSTPGCGPVASSELDFSGMVLGLVEVVVIVVALVVHSGGGCAASLV